MRNMTEDLKEAIITGIIAMVIILGIVLPPVISSIVNKSQEVELEKYKIEMQYKHGDVVEENK